MPLRSVAPLAPDGTYTAKHERISLVFRYPSNFHFRASMLVCLVTIPSSLNSYPQVHMQLIPLMERTSFPLSFKRLFNGFETGECSSCRLQNGLLSLDRLMTFPRQSVHMSCPFMYVRTCTHVCFGETVNL